MASSRMPDEFFDLVDHHLPPDKPVGPLGGRPCIENRIIVRVIWFVLATGNRWADVPLELGCSGRTAHRRLQLWEEAGIWDRLHADLLKLLHAADKLDPDTVIVDSVIVRAFGGGEETGPSPVDRRKPGTKHTLLVDRNGVPLAVRTAPANRSDQVELLPIVLEFPIVAGKPGRPKEHPNELYADRGYDNDSARALLQWLGITPKIARRRTEHGSGLGKTRWVVERTIAWIKGLRRMRVRYDRLSVIRNAWTTLAACAVCFQILTQDVF
jgi:transposase